MLFLNSGSDGSIFEFSDTEIIKIFHTNEKKQKECIFLEIKYKILDNIIILPKFETNIGLVYNRAEGLFVHFLNEFSKEEYECLWNDFVTRYNEMIKNGYLYFDLKVNNVVYYQNKIMLIDCSGIISIDDYKNGNFELYKNNYRSPNYIMNERKLSNYAFGKFELSILQHLFLFLFDYNIHLYYKPLDEHNYDIYYSSKKQFHIIQVIKKLINIRNCLYTKDNCKEMNYEINEKFGLDILYQIYNIIYMSIN